MGTGVRKLELARVVRQRNATESRRVEGRERRGKLEMARVVRQNHAAVHLMATRPELFARQGAVLANWRLMPCAERTDGPLAHRKDSPWQAASTSVASVASCSAIVHITPQRDPAPIPELQQLTLQ